jgi:hypothetical protein
MKYELKPEAREKLKALRKIAYKKWASRSETYDGLDWRSVGIVGPMIQRVLSNSLREGDDPDEVLRVIRRRMSDTYRPDRPELVVQAMFDAIVEYEMMSTPDPIEVQND